MRIRALSAGSRSCTCSGPSCVASGDSRRRPSTARSQWSALPASTAVRRRCRVGRGDEPGWRVLPGESGSAGTAGVRDLQVCSVVAGADRMVEGSAGQTGGGSEVLFKINGRSPSGPGRQGRSAVLARRASVADQRRSRGHVPGRPPLPAGVERDGFNLHPLFWSSSASPERCR